MTTQTADAAPQANRAITVALCFAVAVIEGYDIQAVGVVARSLARELTLEPAQMGWVLAISNVGLVIGASFGGWLADKLGRKPVFIASVTIFGLFTLATALAHDFNTIFAARFLTGLGFGAVIPNMMAIASEIARPERRASTAATMFIGMPTGGATVSLLTANMPPETDWRLIFYIGGAVPLALALLITFMMRETRARGERAPKVDVPHALFGEGRTAPTLLIWLTFLPCALILYLILNWLPTLVTSRGFTEPAAQASLAFNLVSIAGALLFGQLADRTGVRWPFTLAFIGLVGTLVLLSNAATWTLVLALSGAAGFFLLGAQYALNGVVATYYPAAVRGTGSGAATAMGRVGSIIGPLAAGYLLEAGISASNVLMLLAPVAAVAGIAVFLLSFFPRLPS